MEILTEGVTGAIGGGIGRCIAFPFDTLRVRLSACEAGTGLRTVVQRMLEEEGVLGLFRGLPFSAFDASTQKFLYVFVYAALKRMYCRITDKTPGTIISLFCGYFADIGLAPISMPIEYLVVQLQSAPAGASKTAIIHKTLFTYAGLRDSIKSGPIQFILSWKPAFEFAIFDRIKSMILEDQAARNQKLELTPLTAFMVGAVARGIATVIIYPFMHGKVLMQNKLASSTFAALGRILQTEGVMALYRGLGLELMRGMTQSALMFMIMEQLRAKVRNIMLK